MANECTDPGRLCRGRAADPQRGVHTLERLCRVIVQSKVAGLRRRAGPEIKVWFVPHLEVPLRDFIDPIAIDEMRREGRYQRVPFRVIARRRDYRVVLETVHGLARGESSGHEGYFDERPDAVFEESVVDLVYVGKIIDRLPVPIFIVDADFIVQ